MNDNDKKNATVNKPQRNHFDEDITLQSISDYRKLPQRRKRLLNRSNSYDDDENCVTDRLLKVDTKDQDMFYDVDKNRSLDQNDGGGKISGTMATSALHEEVILPDSLVLSDPNHSDDDNDENSQHSISSSQISISSSKSENDDTNIAFDDLSELEQDIVLHETTIESLYSKFSLIQQNIQSEKVKIGKYQNNIQSLNQQHHQLRLLRNTNVALMKSVTFTFQKCLQRLRKKLNQKNVSDSNSVSVNNKSTLSDDQIDSNNDFIGAPINVFESTIDTTNESGKDSDSLLNELLSAPVEFTSHVVNQAIPADSISSCDKGKEFALRDDQLDSSYSFIGVPIDVSESTVEPTSNYGEDSISLLNQLLATPVELTSHIVNPIISTDSISSCDKNKSQDSNGKKLSSSILLNYLQSQCFPSECRIYSHSEHIPNPIHPLHSSISNGNLLNQMMTLTQKEISDTIHELESKNHLSSHNDDMYFQVVWDEIHGTCIDFITSCSYDPHILEFLEDEKINETVIPEEQDKDGYDNIHDNSECDQINLDGHNDAHNTLCPNDLLDGICTDSFCRFQHFAFASNKFSLKKRRRGIKPKKTKLDMKNMNFPPPLQLPKVRIPENLFLQFPSVDEKCCKRTRYQDKDIQEIKEDAKDGLGNMNIDETIMENHIQVQNISRSFNEFLECDFIEVPHLRCEESSFSGEIKKDEIDQIEFQNNHKPFDSSFFSRLSMYGFTILPSSNHGDEEITSFSIHYNKNESSSLGDQMYPFKSQQEKEDANRILSFEIAMIKAIKFCLFAGRFDICLSLLSWGRSICLDLKRNSSRNQDSSNIAHQNHFIILLKVLLDVSRIVTGSLCGRGSLCVHGIYFSQIYLATLEVFLLAYSDILNESSHTTTDGSNHISTNNYFFRACNELFYRYESFRNVSFGLKTQNTQKVDTMIQEKSDSSLCFPDHLLTLELFYHDDGLLNFTMNHFKAVETGKKLARYVANIVTENRNINPQLIVESFLRPITIRMQNYLNKFSLHESMNLTNGRTSLSGISSSYHCHLYLHAIFSPMIFTCFASIILLMRSQHHNREHLSHNANIEYRYLQKTRNHGIILSAKNILIDIIQILDFSRFRSNSEDVMMLLIPFHSLLVTVYVSIGYFSKAQKHVEKVFFSTANNEKSNMAIFSELLWSQLLQLRMSFPTQNENISNLANRPFKYDLHLNKLCLRGDSELSRCALHHLNVVFYNEQSISSMSRSNHQDEIILNSKQSIELTKIREACYKLSLSDSFTSQQKEEQGINGISISRRHIAKFTNSIPYFPRSILFKGWNFEFLHIDSCGLNELPESIGDYLPNLKILDISHNNLRIIPSSVSRMSQLTKLKISFNQITTLPTSLSTSSQLEILLARKNLIHDVSCLVKNSALGGCLSTLDLRENKVDQTSLMMLPLKLSKLSKLLT